MSIVSSTYAVGVAQIDGRKYVTETHTANTGEVQKISYLAAVGADYAAIMASRVPSIDAQLAEAEAYALMGRAS